MLSPLADDAAPAAPSVCSNHATAAVGFLRVPLKPGPKPRFSKEELRARGNVCRRLPRKRKEEEERRRRGRAAACILLYYYFTIIVFLSFHFV